MPDTITNLFGCCCDTPLDRFAITELYGTEYGFPPFQSTFDPSSYLTSGLPPLGATENWYSTPNLTMYWEPMMKFLCVGSYTSRAPAGWTIKTGVSTFAVGDLVHRVSNPTGTYEYHSFYRCKVATAIGGDPAGLPDYFESYQGNRYIPLNIYGITLAYSTPLVHYTPRQVYGTWTEVSKAYDADATEVESYTRQCQMDEYSGIVSVVTDHPGITSDVIDLPATASPAFLADNLYPTYQTLEWNVYYASYVARHPSNLQFELVGCAFPDTPRARMIFTDGFRITGFGSGTRDDVTYFWGVLTDFTISATECFFEFTITVPWSETETKDIIITQTIKLSDALTFQDRFDYLYANLPAIADYNFRDSYQLDVAGAVEQTSHTPLPYVPYGARNYALYQNGREFVNYGFNFPRQGSGTFALNKPVMRRLKYVMETSPHWVKTQVAGDAEVSTQYNTAPLTHTFDPSAAQPPEVVRVVLTAGG